MAAGQYNPNDYPHPGEVLLKELEEIGFSQRGFARYIDVPPEDIEALCSKRASMTALLAIKISRALGGGPRKWVELQMSYDLVRVDSSLYEHIRPLGEGDGDVDE